MKIALMTIWREKNFGAEMQCYALVKALQLLGHKVEVIDYRLSDKPHKRLKHKIIDFLRKFSPETRSFQKFWKNYIPTTRHYKTDTDLQRNPPQADLYITGSDQVWNPDITKDKWTTYFLNFGSDSIRRISYASSFGEEKWEWEDKKKKASLLLRRYDIISSRENSGVELLKDEFHLSSTMVLDPTLLHSDYDELLPECSSESKSLVYYPLIPNPDLEKFAIHVAQQKGLNFINTNESNKLLGKITWKRTSIFNWINNFRNAEMVVTPSFHGLAFSLIFRKQFIIVQNAGGKTRSSRITDLLKALGLEDRYFSSIGDALDSRIWEKPIDYSIVGPKLNNLRKSSWDFLKQSIK